ncbi:MAG: hypothetical protein RIB45_00095 [Marivibrio sp.]|uniref:hypothetical protein n=1 Tax=Marivibrio sp. TaxID=2039719 RepID=UPI0032EC74D3
MTSVKKGRARKPSRRRSRAASAEARTEALRARLAERLPEMLDAAIAAYGRIADQAGGEDPKGFAATQTGAKAALAHIEQLIALAETVLRAAPAAETPRAADSERLVAEARAALKECAPAPSEPDVGEDAP